MKAFAGCMLVGLFALGYWLQATAVMSDDATPAPLDTSDVAAAEEVKTDVPTAPDAEIEALRQELLRLTEQAIIDMDEAELRLEVDLARQRVADSAADAKLEQIRQQLAELIEQYPETAAAGQASAMLSVSDGTLPTLLNEPAPLGEVNFY